MLKPGVITLARPPRIAWMGHATHATGHSRYVLPQLWAIHRYEYTADLSLDGQAYRLRPGAMTLQQPGVVSQYTWEAPGRHLVGHFEMPDGAGGPAYQMPMVIEARAVKAVYRGLLVQAVGAWNATPAQSAAALWHLLWLISQDHGRASERADQRHLALAAAAGYIDQHLGEPIAAADAVQAAGVSHNHLIRLFQEQYGTSIMGYLRQRRAEKARHLLTHSTLPIKAVAIECGIPDAQAFNKMVRRVYGTSPTALRALNGG